MTWSSAGAGWRATNVVDAEEPLLAGVADCCGGRAMSEKFEQPSPEEYKRADHVGQNLQNLVEIFSIRLVSPPQSPGFSLLEG